MNLDLYLSEIDQSMRPEFMRFVQTGDASENFLAYLDRDARAQAAVEQAFGVQAQALENLAQAIKTSGSTKLEQRVMDPAIQMAAMVEQVADIPEQQRKHIFDHVATVVTQRSGEAGARRAQSTLSELQQAFSLLKIS